MVEVLEKNRFLARIKEYIENYCPVVPFVPPRKKAPTNAKMECEGTHSFFIMAL